MWCPSGWHLPSAEAVPALPEGWRHLSITVWCEVRKRSPNTHLETGTRRAEFTWREENQVRSVGFFFCLFACCLWCVTILFFLAVVWTLHSLLLRVSFMEKVAMYVKTEKDSAFSLCSPPTCKGEVTDFVTSFSLSESLGCWLRSWLNFLCSDWQGRMRL